MKPAPLPILVCHACLGDRKRACKGACPCPEDGRDIVAHAEAKCCPLGKFEQGIGDAAAKLIHKSGIRTLYYRVRGLFVDPKRKPCGCEKRRKVMNARFGGLWRWLLEWREAFRGAGGSE